MNHINPQTADSGPDEIRERLRDIEAELARQSASIAALEGVKLGSCSGPSITLSDLVSAGINKRTGMPEAGGAK